ncbi:hypothetical protein ACFQ68_08505 [Amycolatopsis japonica]|uniref:hypothetical protein n=1 Tax=Amycolatopsis japonica TaxID=208439 RepID=UPI00366B720A
MKQKNNLRRAAVYGVAGLATAAIGASTANALVDDRSEDKPAQDSAQAAKPQHAEVPPPQQKSGTAAPQTRQATPWTAPVVPRTEPVVPKHVTPQPVVRPVLPVRAPVAPAIKRTAPVERNVEPARTVKRLPTSVPVVKKAATVNPRAVKTVTSKALSQKRFLGKPLVAPLPAPPQETILQQVRHAAKAVDTAEEAVTRAEKALEKARIDLKKAKEELKKLQREDHEKPVKIMNGDRD